MNPKIPCETVRQSLHWYLLNHLPDEEQKTITQHLATCFRCRHELAQWQEVSQVLRQADERVPLDTQMQTRWEAMRTKLPAQQSGQKLQHTGVIYMDFNDNHDRQDSSLVSEGMASVKPSLSMTPRRPISFRLPTVAAILVVILGALIFTVLRPQHTPATGNALARSTQIPTSLPTALPTSLPVSAPPANGFLLGAAIVSSDDIWAVGGFHPNPAGLIMHYSGGQWATVSGNDFPNIILNAVTMASANEGWAVGVTSGTLDQPIMLHYVNGHWSQFALAMLPADANGISSVKLLSPTAGYAVVGSSQAGQSYVLLYSSGTWTLTKPQLNHQYGFANATVTSDVSMVASGDLWARGDNLIKQYHSGQWQTVYTVSQAGQAILAIDALSDANVWVQMVDLSHNTQGPDFDPQYFLHYDGHAWTRIERPTTMTSNTSLFDFVAPEWAAVELLRPLSTQGSYILHLDQGAWQLTSLPKMYNILTVTSISTSEAWALGVVGNNGAWIIDRLHFLNGVWGVA